MAEMTDRNTLPQWNGRPVPWVTRWTGEIAPDRYELGISQGRMSYKDGQNVRDSHGVLWQREGIGRHGEPDWASVSTYRQRMSMAKRKCQVCGNKIPEGPIHWLMPLNEGYQTSEDENGDEVFLTWNPPTCEGCIPLALELCPHLKRNGYQVLKVLEYAVWGVSGLTVTEVDGNLYPVQAALSYADDQTNPGMIMAQQIVAMLGPYVVEEVEMGTAPQETPEDMEQKMRNFLRNALGDEAFEQLERDAQDEAS